MLFWKCRKERIASVHESTSLTSQKGNVCTLISIGSFSFVFGILYTNVCFSAMYPSFAGIVNLANWCLDFCNIIFYCQDDGHHGVHLSDMRFYRHFFFFIQRSRSSLWPAKFSPKTLLRTAKPSCGWYIEKGYSYTLRWAIANYHLKLIFDVILFMESSYFEPWIPHRFI